MTNVVDELKVERALVRFFAGGQADTGIVATADGGINDARIHIGEFYKRDGAPEYVKHEFRHIITIKLRDLAAAICRGEFS